MYQEELGSEINLQLGLNVGCRDRRHHCYASDHMFDDVGHNNSMAT